MSRHEGVSCDSCLKSNFRGRRYKCLICYDYDLCANCYEDGVTSTRHSSDHPMQCILTRSDFEIYYGGEVLSGEQPQSFTCPYCKKMGLSDAALLEHVGAEHTDTAFEVVCPVCAALPGGEPNLVTDDFAGHLTLEHRTGPRDLISFLDEPSAIRHGGVRRIPHSGRALGGPRSRRSNMHFSSSGGLSALSPSGRDSVDPIAELLSQLSGVRRGAPQPSQLQQLQMQIQLERQQVSAARQHLERLPRRQAHQVVSSTNSSNIGGSTGLNGASNGQQQSLNGAALNGGIVVSGINLREGPIRASSPLLLTTSSSVASSLQSQQNQSQFLLARFMTPTLDEGEQAQLERDRADRSQFVQALMISTLSNVQPIKINDEEISDDMLGLTLNSKESSKKEDDNSDTETKKVQQQQNKQQSPPPPPTNAAPQSNINEEVIEELQPSQHQQHSITSRNSNVQSTKPKQQAAGSKQQQQQQAQSVGGGGGGVNERRVRAAAPQQSAKPRDLKTSTAATGNNTTTMSSSKHVPDTR